MEGPPPGPICFGPFGRGSSVKSGIHKGCIQHTFVTGVKHTPLKGNTKGFVEQPKAWLRSPKL